MFLSKFLSKHDQEKKLDQQFQEAWVRVVQETLENTPSDAHAQVRRHVKADKPNLHAFVQYLRKFDNDHPLIAKLSRNITWLAIEAIADIEQAQNWATDPSRLKATQKLKEAVIANYVEMIILTFEAQHKQVKENGSFGGLFGFFTSTEEGKQKKIKESNFIKFTKKFLSLEVVAQKRTAVRLSIPEEDQENTEINNAIGIINNYLFTSDNDDPENAAKKLASSLSQLHDERDARLFLQHFFRPRNSSAFWTYKDHEELIFNVIREAVLTLNLESPILTAMRKLYPLAEKHWFKHTNKVLNEKAMLLQRDLSGLISNELEKHLAKDLSKLVVGFFSTKPNPAAQPMAAGAAALAARVAEAAAAP